MTLTLEDAALLLENVTYKPGSRLSLHYGTERGVLAVLHLWLKVDQRPQINDTNPEYWDDDTTIHGQRNLTKAAFKSSSHFLWQVAEIFRSIECHEALEWMMVDGLRVYDPHLTSKHYRKRAELAASGVLGAKWTPIQDASTWMNVSTTR